MILFKKSIFLLAFFYSFTFCFSSPTNNDFIDSDNDGFSDILEIQLLTDPYDPLFFPSGEFMNAPSMDTIDNDGDGFSDYLEGLLSTDPSSNASTPKVKTISDIVTSLE